MANKKLQDNWATRTKMKRATRNHEVTSRRITRKIFELRMSHKQAILRIFPQAQVKCSGTRYHTAWRFGCQVKSKASRRAAGRTHKSFPHPKEARLFRSHARRSKKPTVYWCVREKPTVGMSLVLARINKKTFTQRSTRLTLQWVDSSYKKTNGYASARRLKKANKTESFFEAALLNSIWDQRSLEKRIFRFINKQMATRANASARRGIQEQARRCSTTLR